MRWLSHLTAAEPTVIEHLGFYARSVAVYNMTPYPIYINYSAQIPTANSYDLLIPAATSLSQRLPGGGEYAAFLDTAGVTVTFTNPPAVITWDSEIDAPTFAQVHLTYPYSSNLQFLARTRQADQYILGNLPAPSPVTTLLNLVIPDGQLYVIRRVMVRTDYAVTNNHAYIKVDAIRGPAAFYPPIIYHYFSPSKNYQWIDYPNLNIVCSHQTPLGDIRILARNFSAINAIVVRARVEIDVVEARLP